MAIPKRWAVREAAIASFYDITTNALAVSLNTLKMTEVQTTGETERQPLLSKMRFLIMMRWLCLQVSL